MEDRAELVVFDVVMQLWGPPNHGIITANCSPISVHIILIELDASMF